MDATIKLPNPVTVVPSDDMIPPSTDSSALWGEFEAFYAKHGQLVYQCSQANLIATLKEDKKAAIEGMIISYAETAKVVLDGLVTLGKIHPVISAAVETFALLVSLDLARRENDKKVITIRIAMRNMMCTMFHLRDIKETDEGALKTKSTLEGLIGDMIKDMVKCGSDLNGYLNQQLFSRVVGSTIYKERFKEHLDCFAKHQSEIHLAITVHTARGVDRANIQLNHISVKEDTTHTKLDAIDKKLDMFQQLFCTPNEWEALKFFKTHGVKGCLEKDELLAKLVSLVGDDLIDNEKGTKTGQHERRMTAAREELKKDFAVALKENEDRFKKLLKIQQINHNLVTDGFATVNSKLDKLLHIYDSNIKLADPELQRVWTLMGYKTIAKAKHFVLTFRDHYQHGQSLSAPPAFPQASSDQTLQTTVHSNANNLSVETGGQSDNILGSREDADVNAWLLEYLDAAHVRPIVEAMDVDGSGFISVEELNRFAGSRPKQWSLVEWMVYWAAGWHLNIVDYREKIYDILIQMHAAIPMIHTANIVWVTEYLDCYALQWIEGLLRFTLEFQGKRNGQLSALAEFYANIQESSLKCKLEAASYQLASEADARLVGGTDRPESWIYPLLYLILKRHLAIINLAEFHILDCDEMTIHIKTIFSVASVLEQRKDILQAIFSQTSQDVDARFETFACGMFQAAYKSDTEIVPSKNSLLKARTKRTIQSLIPDMGGKRSSSQVQDVVSILFYPPKEFSYPPGELFDSEFCDINQVSTIGPTEHPLSGYWSAVYIDEGGSVYSTSHSVLSAEADGSIRGDYEAFCAISTISGDLKTHPDAIISVRLEYPITGTNYQLTGIYDPEREVIIGEFEGSPIPQLATNTQSEVSDTASNGDNRSIDGQDNTSHDPSFEGPDQETSLPNMEGVREGDSRPVAGIPRDAEYDSDEASDNRDTNSVGGIHEGKDPEDSRSESGQSATGPKGAEQKNRGGFFMTRTPAELLRFRRYLDPESPPFPRPIPSLPMRRWYFAIEATRYQIRARTMTLDFISERFMEQKDYIDLRTKIAYGVATDEDRARFTQLFISYSPSQLRLYQRLSEFLLDRAYARRTTVDFIPCDNCYQVIVGARHRCITCTTYDFTNQIDLCCDPLCIASSISYPSINLVHESSHTLLRHDNYIFAFELPILIPQWRTRSENVKKRFRTLDEQKKMTKKHGRPTMYTMGVQDRVQHTEVIVHPLFCVCCREQTKVTLPCWICAVCDSETAICLDCERTHATVRRGYEDKSKSHSHHHPLLRISDSKEVQSGEVNNARLQQHLNKISSDLHALEGKVVGHLTATSQWIKASNHVEISNANREIEPAIRPLVTGFWDRGSDLPDESDSMFGSDVEDEYGPISVAIDPPPLAVPTYDRFDTTSPGSLLNIANVNVPSVPGSLNTILSLPSAGPQWESVALQDSQARTVTQDRVEFIDRSLSSLQTRVDSLDARLSNMEVSLATVDTRLDQVLSLLNQLATR